MATTEWFRSIFQDFRYSTRIVRKNLATSVLAVATLAIGIAASTLIFSLFYNLTFKAFSARDATRLVVPVLQNLDEQPADQEQPLRIQLLDLNAIRDQNHVFENIVGYITDGGIVLADLGNRRFQYSAARVTADALQFYGVPALLGRSILPKDAEPGSAPVFVMSYRTWKDDFSSNPAILGATFNIDGEPRTLIGIMPPRFQAFGSEEQIWLPIASISVAPPRRADFPAKTLARLKRGVSLEMASADLDVIVKRIALLDPDEFPKHFRARVEPASDSLISSTGWGSTLFHSDIKHLLYDLLAAVTLLLLIACSNVSNLQLAQATIREHEIAVRSALGATRSRLLRQLVIEGIVLAGTACALGCSLSWAGLKIISDLLPRILPLPLASRIGGETVLGIDQTVLLFAISMAVLTLITSGLAPAVYLLRPSLRPALAAGDKSLNRSFRHGGLRAGLVIAEVSLSIVLLIGTGLMIRSFWVLTHVDLGFNPHDVLLTAFLPPPSHARTTPLQRFASDEGMVVLERVIEHLRALPGVTHVAVQDTIPGYGPTRGPEVTAPGATNNEEAGIVACDEEFLPTLELRLLSGRWLTREEVQRTKEVRGCHHAARRA
jgi:putative ABC transport system permease protein